MIEAATETDVIVPDRIDYQSNNPLVAGETEANGIAQRFFPSVGTLLRDRFYLPNFIQPIEDFFEHCNTHAVNVTNMLKGTNTDFDPTFSKLPFLSKHYDVRDIPITLKSGDRSLVTTVRVIESKPGEVGKKLRLVLFSYYNNQWVEGNKISGWDPKTTDELSAVPLEVLRALQAHVTIDSMMCFSLGAIALDGLKNVDAKDSDIIPKTLILNRPLTSIWKVASQLFPKLRHALYQLVKLYELDSNPEEELLAFFQRVSKENPNALADRHVVLFEATRDRYFSGPGALTLVDEIRKIVKTSHGKFFIPLLAELAHHAHRIDHILNNPNSETDVSAFIDMDPNESISQALNRHIFMKEESHTCLIIGGNRDSLDSIIYLQALPILEAHYAANHPSASL